MSNELATIATVTTAVKNIHDIGTGISGFRQRRQIAAGQEEHTRNRIRDALAQDHMSMRQELARQERRQLIEGYEEIEDMLDTPIGGALASSLAREARSYENTLSDFERLTKPGGGFR